MVEDVLGNEQYLILVCPRKKPLSRRVTSSMANYFEIKLKAYDCARLLVVSKFVYAICFCRKLIKAHVVLPYLKS
jgi:hypothetical protein